MRPRFPLRPTLAQKRAGLMVNAPLDDLDELFTGAPTQRLDEMEAAERALRANGTKAPRAKRKSPEHDFQKVVATYLARVLHPSVPWSAFPAGGGGLARGARLKEMGLKKGWPDIILLHPQTGRFLGLELKAKGGRLSDEQRDIQAAIRACGGAYEQAKTIEQIETLLRLWGVPMRGRIGA